MTEARNSQVLRRVGVGVVIVGAIFVIGGVVLHLAHDLPWREDDTFFAPILAATALSATILATKAPTSRVTWTIEVAWLALGANALGFAYVAAYETTGPEALVRLAEWATGTGFFVWLVAIAVVLPSLFPTGKALGPFWRLIPWAASTTLVVLSTLMLVFVMTAELEAALSGSTDFEADFLNALFPVGILGLVAAMVGAFVSLIIRYRRSRNIERKQLQWFLYATAIMLVGAAAEFIAQDSLLSWLMSLGGAALMVSIAIAITRYHLYDIDRIVNRTLVYTVVVTMLAVVFSAAVWAVTQLLPTTDNDLAIVAATLAAAALFNPLRKRVQRFVDRRFNRGRYDAQRVADEFTATIRDEVDPTAITTGWIDVVNETMQPKAIAIWVKPE